MPILPRWTIEWGKIRDLVVTQVLGPSRYCGLHRSPRTCGSSVKNGWRVLAKTCTANVGICLGQKPFPRLMICPAGTGRAAISGVGSVAHFRRRMLALSRHVSLLSNRDTDGRGAWRLSIYLPLPTRTWFAGYPYCVGEQDNSCHSKHLEDYSGCAFLYRVTRQ